MFQWLKFVWLILSKGSLTIRPYDYGTHINKLWKENTEASRLSIEQDFPKKTWKYYFLFVPIMGPIIGMISHYKLQKRWPSYVFHYPEKKLAFIRISKNAGTSVQAALLQSIHPDLDISNISVNQINEMGKVYIKSKLETEYECFAIVRNPFDRLLSCYFDQVIGREERYYYDDYLFRIIKKGMSFENFVKTIQGIPDELKDIHFRPQSHYISHIKGVRLFKIETDLDLITNYLNEFGVTMEFQNKNSKSIEKKDFYTKDLINIVQDIYKEDFDMFDYEVENI